MIRDTVATDWRQPSGTGAPTACPATEQRSELHVLLVTEGTYPFHWGGLSTWCDLLTRELPNIKFSLLAMAVDPLVERRFDLPVNVGDFQSVPLWGIRNAWELRGRTSLRCVRRSLARTTEPLVAAEFVPSFRHFLRQLLGEEPGDSELAHSIHRMYRFFLDHDFDTTFRSRATWDCFADEISRGFPATAARHGYHDAFVSLADLRVVLQWLYHWFFPLSQPIPKVDIVHATMAGICSMVGSVAKLEHASGFVLSEHGIYLRECYLAEHESDGNLFRKIMKLRFARRMTEVGYSLADEVAPCCDHNQRWERQVGVSPDRLRTAYYGVDSRVFAPRSTPMRNPPVVVWAGRIDPLKDVETLLRAAAVVHRVRPDIKFRLFGTARPGNEAYLERCLALHFKLGLEHVVRFEGFASNTAEAFSEGDLVVLSSISEGFPYATLEAMLCGRPIVSTAVGGIAEQVSPSCGILVRPRDPDALGQAILAILEDPAACLRLGRAGRERAEKMFGLDRFRSGHAAIYDRVASAISVDTTIAADPLQHGERAEAERPAFATSAAPGASWVGRRGRSALAPLLRVRRGTPPTRPDADGEGEVTPLAPSATATGL